MCSCASGEASQPSLRRARRGAHHAHRVGEVSAHSSRKPLQSTSQQLKCVVRNGARQHGGTAARLGDELRRQMELPVMVSKR